MIVEDTHEPIIDQYTWECVQRRMEKNKRATSNNTIMVNCENEISLFAGIIRCADCGASMAYVRSKKKGGKSVYRCSRYNNNGKTACSTHTIDAEVLEYVVLKDIQHHAKMVVQDEDTLLKMLLSFSDKQAGHKKPLRKRP